MAKKGQTLTTWTKVGTQDDGRWCEKTYALRVDGAIVSCYKAELSDGSRHNYGWKRVRRPLPAAMRVSERAMTLAAREQEIDAKLAEAGYTRSNGR